MFCSALKTKTLFVFLTVFCFCTLQAQVKNYTVANAHSHNDYEHGADAFVLAFKKGFGSIEADVFPVNGSLYVAHNKKDIKSERSLKAVYLDPLLKEFTSGKKRKLSLLIDIKEQHETALVLLEKELQPLKAFLTTTKKANYLTVIISGDRPAPSMYKNYASFIFFDDDLKKPHTKEEWKRVALVSLPFDKIVKWKGDTDLTMEEAKKVSHIIDSTHAAGKPIRFWAAPDTKTSWQWQMKLHADLIGTDKIEDLAAFLKNQKEKKIKGR